MIVLALEYSVTGPRFWSIRRGYGFREGQPWLKTAYTSVVAAIVP